MIEERAWVVSTEGDFAWVETQRQSACGSCAVRAGCGSATLQQALGNKRARIRALNGAGARSGEEVIVGLHEQALVRGSLAVYAVPLLVMIAAALFAELLNGRWQLVEGEGLTVLAGLLGLGAGFVWLHRFTRRISGDRAYQAVILGSAQSGAAARRGAGLNLDSNC